MTYWMKSTNAGLTSQLLPCMKQTFLDLYKFNVILCYLLWFCRAPYTPIIKYPTDTSNFDEVEEMEPSPYQTDDLRQNGHFPEHAFSEFTFRRFIDDAGLMQSLAISNNLNSSNHTSSSNNNQSDADRTPQNSYHEDELSGRSVQSGTGNSTTGAGNPVYV